MSATTYTDVLIVGAGPTGLMAAVCLSRLNLNIKIIDKRIPGEIAGQADGIQPRTMEIWDSLGMGDKLRHAGSHVYQMATYNSNNAATGIKQINNVLNIPLPSVRYPFELIVPVEDIEGIMKETLAEANISIDQPSILDKFTLLAADDYPIHASCIHLNEQRLQASRISQHARADAASQKYFVDSVETIRAKFMIGCDGAQSWVRQQCGISMNGTSIGLSYGVIDFTPSTNFPSPRAKSIIESPISGALGYIPRPNGTARAYALLKDASLVNTLDTTSLEDMTEHITDIVRNGFLPYEMQINNVTWCNTYKVSQRVASRFSHEGRVFIAGDACHTHSPNAGQGANVSMVDAYNLAWKIAYVVNGWSGPSILDTYEQERRPYSLELIEFDKEIEKLFHPEGLSPEEYAQLWHRHLMFTTGVGVQYRSSLTASADSPDVNTSVQIGERLPPSDLVCYIDWNPCNIHDILRYNMQFKLVVFAGDIAQDAVKRRFCDFIAALHEMAPPKPSLDIYAVIDTKKEELNAEYYVWMREYIPEAQIFIDDGIMATGIHGVSVMSSGSGAAVLVRPDGHVAMIIPVSRDNVHRVRDYLSSL